MPQAVSGYPYSQIQMHTTCVGAECERELSNMDRLAYGIRSAAEVASVSEHAIKVAVREGALATRMLCGERVILHEDLHAWVDVTSGAPVSV